MYKTTDPVFDEAREEWLCGNHFVFFQEVELPVTHDELHAKSLCVSVWDWSQTMRNTNIGIYVCI